MAAKFQAEAQSLACKRLRGFDPPVKMGFRSARHCRAAAHHLRQRRAFRQDFLPSTAFFVDKGPACYYNNVVKMALLCGFAAVQNK